MRALFPALKARHPRSILVVDEIDLVGAERSESDAATRRTLAALLTALDGLRPAAGVLVIAATSQSTWDLDPALLRAGRLGFVIELRHPDEATRARLLGHFLAGRPLAPDVDLDPLAAIARSDTPADLRAACADAAGIALAAGRDVIAQADLAAALGRGGRVLPAEPEPGPVEFATLRRVCAHEAGHLVAGAVLAGPERLLEVKIGPEAGSVVFVTGDGDADLDERTARDAITTLLAGFAAERIILGTGSLAHSADVREAMTIARRLVEGGLEPGVPPLDARVPWLDGTTVRDRFADAIAGLLAAGRERAAGILGTHAMALAAAARRLEDEVMPRLADDPRREPVVLDLDALRADLARLLAPGEPEPVDPQPAPDAIPAASGNGRLH